jgi:hypothetical protein
MDCKQNVKKLKHKEIDCKIELLNLLHLLTIVNLKKYKKNFTLFGVTLSGEKVLINFPFPFIKYAFPPSLAIAISNCPVSVVLSIVIQVELHVNPFIQSVALTQVFPTKHLEQVVVPPQSTSVSP